MPTTTTPATTTTTAQQQRAWDLRQQGYTFAQVASLAGYANSGSARHAVMAVEARRAGTTYNRRQRRQALRGTNVTWGVEFEVESIGQAGACRATEVALGLVPGTLQPAQYHAGSRNGYRGWTVERDGSLGNGGAEVVSPILTGLGDLATAGTVLEALRAGGATTSNRCGQHVHVSVRHLTTAQLCTLFDFWAAGVGAINALLPAARRNASYAANFDTYRAEQAKQVAQRQRHATSTERYLHINVQNLAARGTIEVRCQEGHTSSARLRTWVRLLLAIVEAAEAGRLVVRNTNSVAELIQDLDLPAATARALCARAGEVPMAAAA